MGISMRMRTHLVVVGHLQVKMSRYSVPERIALVKFYYANNNSPIAAQRKFATEFKLKTTGPSVLTINNLIRKFERTGSVGDDSVGNVGRQKSVKTPENIQKTRAVFQTSPRKSIRRAAQQVGINRETLRQIVVEDLHLFPYKIQTHQPLSPRAMEQRLCFANTIVHRIDEQDFDVNMVWFSDEAHFHLDGFVNKQNWRIWGTEKPHFVMEKSLHPQRVTVWCAMSSHGIIGPTFVDGTVNTERYVKILENDFIPIIQSAPDFDKMWFMQDGARPHRTRRVFDVLEEHFGDRILALGYRDITGMGLDWPPYSPDLNPCDSFLWGYIKDKVYSNNPKTIAELKTAIQEVINSIDVPTLQRVMQNFAIRLRHIITNDGRHIEHVIT